MFTDLCAEDEKKKKKYPPAISVFVNQKIVSYKNCNQCANYIDQDWQNMASKI